MLSRMLGGDADKAHDSALVIGAKDVLIGTHGEKRGTAVMAARLEDADVSSLSERLSGLGSVCPTTACPSTASRCQARKERARLALLRARPARGRRRADRAHRGDPRREGVTRDYFPGRAVRRAAGVRVMTAADAGGPARGACAGGGVRRMSSRSARSSGPASARSLSVLTLTVRNTGPRPRRRARPRPCARSACRTRSRRAPARRSRPSRGRLRLSIPCRPPYPRRDGGRVRGWPLAQLTHVTTSGIAASRFSAIGSPHTSQSP